MLIHRFKSTYARSLFETLKTEESLFDRQIKFFEFCKQMTKLESLHKQAQHQQFIIEEKLKRIALSSKEPVRDVFQLYLQSRSEFSSQLLVDCLEYLGKMLKAKTIPSYSDLTLQELSESWPFQQILRDLNYGLDGQEYIPPIHISRIAISMADIGYKDVELFSKMMNYIKQQIENPVEPRIRQIYKHHIYSGFQNHEEFKNHINTILAWKDREKAPQHKLMSDIESFTESIHNLKYLQKNFASAIANINEQYYLLVSAQQTYDFLKNNDAVTLGLNHLQETLVKAGILNPYELEDAENFENLEKLMQRAEGTFENIVREYFPFLNSPMVDSFYEASKEYSKAHVVQSEGELLPNPNTVTANVLGNMAVALSHIMHIETGDFHDNDYPNDPWMRRAKPTQHELAPKGQLYIELPYTNMWLKSREFIHDVLPSLRNTSKVADLTAVCNILYGVSYCHIADPELLDILSARIEELKHESADIDILSRGLFGLGMSNSHPEAAKTLVSILSSRPDLHEIGFSSLIKSLWCQCVLDIHRTPEFSNLLKIFNTFELTVLNKHDNELFKEVLLCMEHELKIPESNLNYTIATAKTYAISYFAQGINKYYDPVKPLLAKTGRFILTQTLPEEEARRIHKKLLETEKFPMFKCDDVIAMNGFKVPVFLLGEEGVYKNHLLGNYALKVRLYKSLGMRGLPIPIHQILSVDPYKPHIEVNSLECINEYVEKYVGLPKNHLEQMDHFTSEFIKVMRQESQDFTKLNSAIVFFEDLLGAYKIQTLSRCKSGKMHLQGLEEVKIQLFKAHSRYLDLSPTAQRFLDKLAQEHSKYPNFSELIKSVNEGIVIDSDNFHDFWASGRQNMQLPNTTEQKADITDEIMNHGFIMLSDYFQYKDWAKDIMSGYPLQTDMSLYEDDLFNNHFFIHRRQQIGMLPNPKAKINAMALAIPEQVRIKAFLTNLKYELKRNFCDKEISQKILGLKVLENLMEEHLRPRQAHPKRLQRDPMAYTEFLHQQIKVKEDNDHYVKFYREVYAETSLKKEIFDKMVKNIKAVSRKKEFDVYERLYFKKEMLWKYTNTKEALDIGDPEKDIYFDPIFRQSFGYSADPRTLRPRTFDLREEPDFITFDSDKDFLQFKQRKAETNLIKLRILTKLFSSQPLSKIEQEYLSEYKSALKSAKITEAGRVMVPAFSTSLCFRDLPEADKSIYAGLHKVHCPSAIEDYSLNELLFELSHFLDDYLIRRLEFNIIEQREFKSWGITPDPTGGSKLKPLWKNKGLWWQNSALEEYLWRKTGDLSPKDESDFLELYGYHKNKSFIEQVYWKMDTGSFKELMEEAKGSDFKLRFVRQWWRRKLMERDYRFTVPDGKFALPDKQIFEYRKKEIVEKIRNELEEWLGMKYEEINAESIVNVVEKLKTQINVNNDERTKEFVKVVYFHPELPERYREEIYSIIQNLGIEIYDGAFVFGNPIPVRGDKLMVEISGEEWERRIENASINFLPQLIQKLVD